MFKKSLVPKSETLYIVNMRIISNKILREFWQNHSNAEQPLKAWHSRTKQARWKSADDVKKDYRNASFVANNRIIFNIKGNNYRLIVSMNYMYQLIYIRFVGTHKEYDSVDAKNV